MIAVVTTTPKYYTQNNTHCRLRTVISSFRFDVNLGINNLIYDQAIDENGNVLEVLKERNSHYAFQEVDGLFQYLQQPITLDKSFMEQLSTLIASALLIETKSRPHRGTTHEDWELYVEPVVVIEEPIEEVVDETPIEEPVEDIPEETVDEEIIDDVVPNEENPEPSIPGE